MSGRLGLWAGSALLLLPPVARAEEADGGNPIFSIDTGLVVWTWVVFLLLLFILGKTAWKPLLRVLEQRERRIQETLDEAKRQREEAERLLEEQRKLLGQAHERAQEVVAQGRKAAEQLKGEFLEEGRREQQEMIERARGEIAGEQDRALEALRREAVDLSLAAAAKLLRKEVDSAENRRLVEEFLKELPARDDGGRAGRGAGAGRARRGGARGQRS